MSASSATRLRRSTYSTLAFAVAALGAVALATAVPAHADPPTSLSLTPVAPFVYAEGGPASLVVVNARQITTAPDGSVLYYDSSANEIRRVDAISRQVTVVAGNGQPSSGPLDTTAPSATATPLPLVDGLWTDAAGDVFAWACAGSNCGTSHDLYRLAAATGKWTLAIANPRYLTPGATLYSYAGFAVAADGAIFATDTRHFVVRRFDSGADPSSAGTIVGGTLDTPGTGGDGGPATSATITPSGPLAVAPTGDIYFADGGWAATVRHIDAAGAISALPDSVNQPGNPVPVIALATSTGPGPVYALRRNLLSQEQIRAMPVNGDAPSTVAGPLPACASNTEACLGSSLAQIDDAGTPSVATAGQGSILSWPADGSDPLAYHRYAGILNDTNGLRSPDGTPMNQSVVSSYYDIAVSPAGGVAIAAFNDIRTFTGITPTSTLGTLVPGIAARSLAYAADGTLYAMVPDPSPHLIAVTPGGSTSTVLGGGTHAVTGGADGTDVLLPYGFAYAVDRSNNAIYFVTGGTLVWRLDPTLGHIDLFGNVTGYVSNISGLAVDADHSVLVGGGGALARMTPDGTSADLLCGTGCPTHQLEVLDGGSVVGAGDSGSLTVLAPNGALRRFSGLSSIYAVTADNRFLVPANQGLAGGLFALSGPIPATSNVDAPSAQVSAAPGAVKVDVTPDAVTGQHIKILAAPEDADGHWTVAPTVADDTLTDGSGAAYERLFTHLFTTWPAEPGSAPPTFRIEVLASEGDNVPGHDAVTNAPQIFHVQPTLDTTPPNPPGLALTTEATAVNVHVIYPTDADFDRVVVCKVTNSAAPTQPWGCFVFRELPRSSETSEWINDWVDPLSNTTYTAFSIDASGNASTPVSVTRAAAHLVPGKGVSGIGYDAQPGVEEIVWQGAAAHVRYSAGTVPPATMSDGTEAGQYSGVFGSGTKVPVTDGNQVAVSIFTWADDTQSTYKRASFVLTGGTNSDAIALSATATVNPGVAPTVTATITRNSPVSGPEPITGHAVFLYRRLVGSKNWTFVSSSQTDNSGHAGFTVTPQSGAADYEARYYLANSLNTLAASPIARSNVRQLVTATMPSNLTRGRRLVVTGQLTPHRAGTLQLQRLKDHTWVTIASTQATTTGSYRIVITPRTSATWTLRVAAPPTTKLLAGRSSTRQVQVTA